jgi:hypothetical protein
MDFKVTGTEVGVTALQMDIKTRGINEAIIRTGLEKARVARLAILGKMLEALPEARTEMSAFAPRIITIKINPRRSATSSARVARPSARSRKRRRPRSTSRTTARSRSRRSTPTTHVLPSTGSRA